MIHRPEYIRATGRYVPAEEYAPGPRRYRIGPALVAAGALLIVVAGLVAAAALIITAALPSSPPVVPATYGPPCATRPCEVRS